MAVRWTDPDITTGYGVWGELVTNNTPLKVVDMVTLTQEIPKLTAAFTEEDTLTALLLTVRWRFSLRLLEAEDASINTYSPALGIRQLGRYNIEAYDYTCHSDFWSHDLYISPRFAFRVRYIDFELDLDPPSSEPQGDDPDLVYTNGTYYPWQGFYNFYNTFSDNIGQRLLLYANPPVQLYRLGITYDFQWEPYNTERITKEGGVPNAYLL